MIFKKIRLFSLIVKAFLQKEKKVIFLGLLVGMAIFLFILKVVPYIPRPKPTEKIGLVGNYTFENLPLTVLNLASSGLTRIGPQGKPLPSLAGKWDVDKEGRVYTFLLAENIFWQDGSEVVAEDINYQLPEVECKILDPRRIQFILKEPFTPLPNFLSTPVFKENYLGTGKYEIKRVQKNGPFVEKIFLVGPDKNITFSFYPTSYAAYLAFKLGEIDILSELSKNPFDGDWPKHITLEAKINKEQYVGIFLNLRDKNLNNKNLRQALAYATPKPEGEYRAIGPIGPNSWAFNSEIKKYPVDASQAKKLFKKFSEESNSQELKLTLDTTDNLLPLAEEIAKTWQETLEVKVEIKLIDKVSNEFQALLITSQIPSDPDQYTFWHSTQETNITAYKSPKVDKILEDARRIIDQEARKEKYSDFQKFLLEDCPVIFISHPQVYTVKRKRLFTPTAASRRPRAWPARG